MGRIEKKWSKDKSSFYFLIYNNLSDSQPRISTIIATSLVETSSFTEFYPLALKTKVAVSFPVILKMKTPEIMDNAFK